jgi:hypothetical protein
MTRKQSLAIAALVFVAVALGYFGHRLDRKQQAGRAAEHQQWQAAKVAELDHWWKAQNNYNNDARIDPPGTVYPAGPAPAASSAAGRLHLPGVARHVRTKAEYREELKEAAFYKHMRGLVKEFRVTDNTVTVVANTVAGRTYDLIDYNSDGEKREAQELCREAWGFIVHQELDHKNTADGRLDNVSVVDANGNQLTSRLGPVADFARQASPAYPGCQ